MSEAERDEERLAEEESVKEKVDSHGVRWRKVYFGGGPHFTNWLEQTIELCGRENVQVEEAQATGLACFEQGGEKVFRIWVRHSAETNDFT